uniref:Immunoglobulin V-set domain-containing protein n=1 Tax=Dicentrarchus labrax TaxID=13489 RepID=A0A8P4K1W9_DICLA
CFHTKKTQHKILHYLTAKTTITCDYPENKQRSSVKFLCRENNFTCEEILSTNFSVKSNGTFTLTETNSGFSVSISNVSSHDAGLYWCGVKEGNYRTGLRKIQLKVEGEQHTSDTSRFDSLTHITEVSLKYVNFTYWCAYPNGAPIKKFICKGEDPSICQPLVNTVQRNMNTSFSMKEDKEKKRNITITVREVTADDSGTYWCGAESTDTRRTFFHRFLMTVGESCFLLCGCNLTLVMIVGGSVKEIYSHYSLQLDLNILSYEITLINIQYTDSPKMSGSQVVITLVVCVAVLLLLLFVIILILIYKPLVHTVFFILSWKDYVYEEVQVYVQKPDSGNAVTTIYATANFPTNPSASLHYSTINFSSDKAGGEAVILKPSSSACEYSIVQNSQSPTYSTVSEPSRSPEDPLYSTVNKPK